MIDHISIAVRPRFGRNLLRRRVGAARYDPLGERDTTIGYGTRHPEFWLNSRPDLEPVRNAGAHVCLRAKSEAAVWAFHAAALSAGALDDGAPGPRAGAMTAYFGRLLHRRRRQQA